MLKQKFISVAIKLIFSNVIFIEIVSFIMHFKILFKIYSLVLILQLTKTHFINKFFFFFKSTLPLTTKITLRVSNCIV